MYMYVYVCTCMYMYVYAFFGGTFLELSASEDPRCARPNGGPVAPPRPRPCWEPASSVAKPGHATEGFGGLLDRISIVLLVQLVVG